MMLSWLKYQGLYDGAIWTHSEVQRKLVQVNDKEANFIGSKSWIGSIEISLILDSLGIPTRLVHLPSLEGNLDEALQALDLHFSPNGSKSPVFIGGGHYAYCIAGVDRDEVLVVDPHLERRPEKNGVSWKKLSSIGKRSNFYNLCFMQLNKPRKLL
jgi:hypothetical protein